MPWNEVSEAAIKSGWQHVPHNVYISLMQVNERRQLVKEVVLQFEGVPIEDLLNTQNEYDGLKDVTHD